MEEETQEQTYAYEVSPNAEEIFKIKKKELKELKKKSDRDREVRLANNAQKRTIRDDKIERVDLKLKTIKEHMVEYNRMGKFGKNNTDILGTICDLIKNDVELNEEIERGKDKDYIGADFGKVEGSNPSN